MKPQEQLKSSAALPPVAGGAADESQVVPRAPMAMPTSAAAAEQAAPQFVNEHVIGRVLGVPVKTLRNWRVSGRGPPFNKFGATVRYELATAIRWARSRQVNSTSEPT